MAEAIDVDTGELESFLHTLDLQYAGARGDFSLLQAWRDLQNNSTDGLLSHILEMLKTLCLRELKACSALFGQVLALSILSLLLSVLQDSFSSTQVAQLSRWVIYLLLIGLSATVFLTALEDAAAAVETVSDLLLALLPILFPVLMALGGVTSVAALSPMLLLALNWLIWLIRQVVFPLIWFYALLQLVDRLSPRFSVNRLAGLCKDIAMGVLSVVTTVFIAVLSLSGVVSASRDGLTFKAAKTASGAFIPVVGRTLADSLDSVLGTLLVLKGAVGSIGALALLLICAIPAVRILIRSLLFRISGALVQTLGDDELASALGAMGNALTLLFAALAVCCLFAFFALALVLGMGSITMMMR